MQGLTSIEDAESFMLKHGENIVDILGGEVDRIEKNLKVRQISLSTFSSQYLFACLCFTSESWKTHSYRLVIKLCHRAALRLTTLRRPSGQSLAVAHVNTSDSPRRQPCWYHPRIVRLSVMGHS